MNFNITLGNKYTGVYTRSYSKDHNWRSLSKPKYATTVRTKVQQNLIEQNQINFNRNSITESNRKIREIV